LSCKPRAKLRRKQPRNTLSTAGPNTIICSHKARIFEKDGAPNFVRKGGEGDRVRKAVQRGDLIPLFEGFLGFLDGFNPRVPFSQLAGFQ